MSDSTGEQNAVKLQSDEHEELLNIIDRLRSQGVSRFVDLPQLIVCGDQSSGKSSVLEAVSGVQFPTSDNLCTRFATELILRRGPEQPITFTIQSGERNSEPKRQKLGDFNARCDDVHKIAEVIESAKSAMGLTGNSKNFSNEILRIEISGPVQPNLTLVDLPGLFHAGNKAQSTEEAEIVKSLVLSYMKKQRSIILAVVSAKNDYANQIVTRYASELDPNGLRTLGIITKPDTLPAGSDSERAFVELAENKDVNFRLGWHVLRNRDYDMRNASADARDRKEAEFFSEGTWRTLPPSILGIGMLKPRLSNVLKDQILSELPSLVRDTQISLNDCIGRLSRLGVSRGNIKEQRDYLQKVGSEFSSLITAAIGGHYTSEFFGSAMQDYGYNKRLRAVVQNTCVAFAEQIRIRGHAKDIRDTVPPTTNTPPATRKDADVPPIVVRQKYMDEVEYLMARTRGCELPGTFNPHIVGELFFEQSRPWGGLVRTFMEKILNATTTTINLILEHVADPLTGDRLLRHVINPALTQIRQELDVKVKELLEPHQHGHPITYNHYFTDNLQKSRQEKFQQQIKKKLTDYFGTYGNTNNSPVDIARLAKTLTQDTEKDMDRHACSEAIECMLAYYKVAMKNLVDDVSKLGFESCLMKKLPQVLTARTVNDLDDKVVMSIAGETEASQIERKRLIEKQTVLIETLDILNRLNRHKPVRQTEMVTSSIWTKPAAECRVNEGCRDTDFAGAALSTNTCSLPNEETDLVERVDDWIASVSADCEPTPESKIECNPLAELESVDEVSKGKKRRKWSVQEKPKDSLPTGYKYL